MDNVERLFTEKEEAEIIPLIKEGQVILLLGVGFSTNLKNKKGKIIPTGDGLSTLMNHAIISIDGDGFQDEECKGSLKKVSESYFECYKNYPILINDFFRNHFTVDKSSIPEMYKQLKLAIWKDIYTTNYDNLLEEIYQPEEYHKSVFKYNSSILPLDDAFNICYLNGDLNINARKEKKTDRLITDVICSAKDYASQDPAMPIWNYFVDKFRQNHVIIIGSKLDEENFYSRICNYEEKTNENFSKSPKSYLINIDGYSADTKTKEAKYNIVHKKGKTEDFLNWIGKHFSVEQAQSKSDEPKKIFENNLDINFIEHTKNYWESLKGKKDNESLIKYYTNINSSPILLPYIVAEDFYIEPNEDLVLRNQIKKKESSNQSLEYALSKIQKNTCSIIRLNDNGGTGKSTFLLHIGKKYCEKYHILYFKDLTDINQDFPVFPPDDKQIIILLDNYGKQVKQLKDFAKKLNQYYYSNGYCLITTERFLKLSALDKEILKEIDENFEDIKECSLNSNNVFYEHIFNKLINFIDEDNELFFEKREQFKKEFIFNKNKNATIAERIIYFLISIKQSDLRFQFRFDWEDWDTICLSNPALSIYSKLYSIVAVFNKYEITPPIQFCIDLLNIDDSNLINTYNILTEQNYNFPITIQKDHCLELRNPNLAEYYVNEKDSSGSLTKKYFKEALGNFDSHLQMYFLRNIYRNPNVLKDENISNLFSHKNDQLIALFENYINNNKGDQDNSKNKMEMVMLYSRSNDKSIAKSILYEMISDNADETYARTKLVSILLKEGKESEARPIILYLALADPGNNYYLKLLIDSLKDTDEEIEVIKDLISKLPMDNFPSLKYLYAKLANALRRTKTQINLKEAEVYCLKLLEMNPYDFAAMNSLGIIYQDQNKFKEAEEILLKSIEVEPFNAANYNELGQLNIKLFEETRNVEYKYNAFHYFLKGVRIIGKNIPLRTELARFLMNYCNRYNAAEKILLNNIIIQSSHSHSYSELGKVYQKKLLFEKSRDILEKGIEQINGDKKIEHISMFVILGNTYLELHEYFKAEETFRKSIEIKPNNWVSHIGIAKALLKQEKQTDFESEINLILNKVCDVQILREFVLWLKQNEQIEVGLKIIAKAKELNTNKSNIIINTTYADLILSKIGLFTRLDSLEVYKLVDFCERICLENLKENQKNEQTLHILYKLYVYLRNKTPLNYQLRNSYSKKYKKYLSSLFLCNPYSNYVFEAITNHIKTTRRYRLGIAFIKEYGSIEKNSYLYLGQLAIFYGFLGNDVEVNNLRCMAISRNLNFPNITPFYEEQLISQDNIGILQNGKIIFENKEYELFENSNRNSHTAIATSIKSIKGVKVYFGLYKIKDRIFANSIERYFENLPKDSLILNMLELSY